MMSFSETSKASNALSSSNSSPLVDGHGRSITYLRLSITDRCNLRCRYCMPEDGIDTVAHDQTLSYEELQRLVSVFKGLGVGKVRITGGEPFVRRGCLGFLRTLKHRCGIEHLMVTTNGVAAWRYLDELRELPISGLNLSLDTLDPERFRRITRRDAFAEVWRTFHGCLIRSIPLKINSVMLEDTSDAEIRALTDLARSYPISLRFIEPMPFSGNRRGRHTSGEPLRERLRRLFPELTEKPATEVSTARRFELPGFVGTVGMIEGHSRSFCASCNKVRITPQGLLKACLYDNGVLDLRTLLRSGTEESRLADEIRRAIAQRRVDGHATEAFCSRPCEPSMSTIGG